MSNASDERIAERRQRQREGIDALWARGLLRKTRDQHRRSAQSHSYVTRMNSIQKHRITRGHNQQCS